MAEMDVKVATRDHENVERLDRRDARIELFITKMHMQFEDLAKEKGQVIRENTAAIGRLEQLVAKLVEQAKPPGEL